jgi:hypothetical protein
MNTRERRVYLKICKESSDYCCWIHINPKTLQWICTSEKANKGILVNKKLCDDCLLRNKNSGNTKNFKLL